MLAYALDWAADHAWSEQALADDVINTLGCRVVVCAGADGKVIRFAGIWS